MKRTLILFFIIWSITLHAQTQEGVRWISKFGLALGVNPVYAMPDVEPVNDMMPGFGLDKFTDSGMFGFGGSGYVYILLIDNFRIGGAGFGVSSSVSGDVNGVNREAKYSIGIGGLTAEYTLPFIRPVAVSVGAIIGAGSMNIELYQNSQTISWEDVWAELSDNSSSAAQSSNLENSFYTFTPTINIDYPLTRYLALRVGAGYILSFDNDWSLNNDQSINGVPDDLKADSFFVQAGVYFGFFAF